MENEQRTSDFFIYRWKFLLSFLRRETPSALVQHNLHATDMFIRDGFRPIRGNFVGETILSHIF